MVLNFFMKNIKMIKRKYFAAFALTALAVASSQAANINVTVLNLTGGTYFTPLFAAAHPPSVKLFTLGAPASPEMRSICEVGIFDPMATLVKAAGAQTAENFNTGPLLPATLSKSFDMVTTAANTQLSFATMLIPTNDGFTALDSWTIPSAPGTYTMFLNAYDCGTEANNELINLTMGTVVNVPGIPADPGGKGGKGTGGTGVVPSTPNDQEPNVIHIHPGIVGSINPKGPGPHASELDFRVHRWLNPVARVTVIVK
jgi:hypothetical protein